MTERQPTCQAAGSTLRLRPHADSMLIQNAAETAQQLMMVLMQVGSQELDTTGRWLLQGCSHGSACLRTSELQVMPV